jgi:hypothetical protein
MKRELGLLNLICILVALAFLALAIYSVFAAGDFFTIDNLFIITVSLVMALVFAVNPLLYLKFMKKSIAAAPNGEWGQLKSSSPPLLDAKGRAVPPDVKAIVARLGRSDRG